MLVSWTGLFFADTGMLQCSVVREEWVDRWMNSWIVFVCLCVRVIVLRACVFVSMCVCVSYET